MQERQIIFHKTFGFGIISSISYLYANVKFSDGGTRKIKDSFLHNVSDEIVNYIIDEKFSSYFDSDTLKKAKTFADNNQFEVSYKGNGNFEADLFIGADFFISKIIITNNSLINNCNCNQRTGCFHNAAVLYRLQSIFSFLSGYERLIENDREIISNLSNNLIDSIDDYFFSGDEKPENIINIIDELSKNDADYLKAFLTYLFIKYRENGYQDILSFICYNNSIRNLLINIKNSPQYCSNMRFLNNCIKDVNNAYDNITYNRRYDIKNILNYHLFNFQYKDFIKKVIVSERFIFDYFYHYFIYIINKIEIDEEIINCYIQAGTKIKDISYLEPLYEKFSQEQKLSIILNGRMNMKLKYSQIRKLNDETRKSLLLKVEFDNKTLASAAIEDGKKLFSDDYRSLAQLYININLNIHSYFEDDFTKKLLKEVNKLPNNYYLKKYIENRYNTFDIENNYFNHYYQDYGQCDYSQNFSGILKDDFLYYFKPYYEISKDEQSYEITYYLLTSLNQCVIQAVYDSSNNFKTIFNSLDNSCDEDYISYLKYYIDQTYSQQIENEIVEIRKQIEEKIRKERNRKLLDELNQLQMDNNSRFLIFDDHFKVSLDYGFTINNSNHISVEFKVGNSRKYVVKDGAQFLENFRDELTVDYGKSLKLTHKIENFVNCDQQILKQLLKIDFNSAGFYYDRKKLSINQSLFKEMITILNGNTVSLNNKVFLINLNKQDIRIKVDKDYVISLDYGNDDCMLFLFDDYALIADYRNSTINIIEVDKNKIMAFRFVINNEGYQIKDVIEPFKNKIYAYYPDIFTIDEQISDEFRLSNMVIRAYFDYDNRNIIVENRYFIDDREIKHSEIDRDYDKASLNIYEEYLKSLGFSENIISNDSDVLSFLRMDFSTMKKMCEVYLSENIKNKIVSSFSAPTIRIKYENDLMSAFLQDSIYSNEELEEIMKAIRHKKKYVLLTGNRIVSLQQQETEQFADAVADIGMDISRLNDENQISVSQSLRAFAHENNCQIDDYLHQMINEISTFKESDFEIPAINGELRQYQKEGYLWMKILEKYHVGGILADDMGLGKTIEVIALIAGNSEEKPYLIICPKSVVFNWKYEIQRFAPELVVKEIYGNRLQRKKIIEKIEPDKKIIYLSAYDSLRNDIDDYQVQFRYVIIDEAQYIKNVNALKTQSVKQIKSEHRLALTGTPIENNIIDLWSIFDFIMPGYFENLSSFRSKYTDSEKFTDIVARRVAPFILRRTKENVINDLPEKFERILSAEMTVNQQKIYDSYRLNAQKMLKDNGKSFELLQYLTRLRQICVDPSTFIQDYEGGSGKMDLLKEIIHQYIPQNRRLLIFSSFVKALNEIEILLKEMNINYFMITGATDGRKRIEIAESFNNNSEEQIVLISLKAGGTGLNLTGADTVIHLDPWWNVSAENQATDRAHRIGQKNTVEVIKLICSDSIEQRVIELQNMKKDLIDRLISDDEQSIMSSSIEDINFILD